MPRIESSALKAAESADAAVRSRDSEDRLISSMEKFARQVLKRRKAAAAKAGVVVGKTVRVHLTEQKRATMRQRLQTLVEAAS